MNYGVGWTLGSPGEIGHGGGTIEEVSTRARTRPWSRAATAAAAANDQLLERMNLVEEEVKWLGEGMDFLWGQTNWLETDEQTVGEDASWPGEGREPHQPQSDRGDASWPVGGQEPPQPQSDREDASWPVEGEEPNQTQSNLQEPHEWPPAEPQPPDEVEIGGVTFEEDDGWGEDAYEDYDCYEDNDWY